jgi:hypothetical protein
MPGLVLVALAKLARHHLVAPRRFFLRFVGELGFHYIVVERAYSLSKVDAVERKPCAQSPPPGLSQPMIPSALFSVLSDVGTPFSLAQADRGSASRDRALSAPALRAHDKDPPLTSRYHVRSIPPAIRASAGFDSG